MFGDEPMLKFRDMLPEDADNAAALMLEVVQEPPFSYDFMDKAKAGRYINDITRTPGFHGFVCEDGQGLRAFCIGLLCDYFSAPYYEIKEIFVRSNLQGTGIGAALLRFAEDWARARGAAAVSLATSPDIPAYGFYLKNGYAAADSSVHMSKNIL
jgi:aminoglycoside 6'-N-acetyltransferase I